ncbi:spartin-like isoform X2 [Glandiceps talaboti]
MEQPTARPVVYNGQTRARVTSEGVDAIKKHHDEAYTLIEHALTYDEQGMNDLAISFYSKGLRSLIKGLEVPSNGPQCVGDNWNNARALQSKMKKTARQMKSRLEALESGAARGASRNHYDDSYVSQLEAEATLADSILQEDEPPSYEDSEANARQILSIEEGVQLYFLNPHGHVSAPSAPGPLRIFQFVDGQTGRDSNKPPAFIQVSDWVYPLLPRQSPALKSLEGAYLFPDINTPEKGSYVGVILSPHVHSSQVQMFEDVLTSLAALRIQHEDQPPVPAVPRRPEPPTVSTVPRRPQPPRRPEPPTAPVVPRQPQSQSSAIVAPRSTTQTDPVAIPIGTRQSSTNYKITEFDEEKPAEEDLPQWSTTISKGLSTGAEWISWGLGKGATMTGKLVHKGASKLRQQLQPEEKPTEVDPKYQQGVEYAKQATGVAVTVSKFLVDTLCDVSKKIADKVGPVVRREGEKYLPESWKSSSDGEGNDTIDGVIHVAASGFRGFGTLFIGLEQAAKILAKNVSDATVETVDHKYGSEAAKVTEDGLNAGLNVGLTVVNIKQFGIKAIAKRAARDTGEATAKDYASERERIKKEKDELQNSESDILHEMDKDGSIQSNNTGCVKFSK